MVEMNSIFKYLKSQVWWSLLYLDLIQQSGSFKNWMDAGGWLYSVPDLIKH